MIRAAFLLFLCFLASEGFSQKKKSPLKIVGFSKPFLLNGKSVVMADTETTNAQWVEFLRWATDEDRTLVTNPFNQCVSNIGNDDSSFSFENTVYRDTVWFTKKGKKVRSEVPCKNLPITGITYQQALKYCEYMTAKFKDKEQNLVFRLPTPDEITWLLQTTVSFYEYNKENPYKTGLNKKGCMIFNFKHNSWCETNLSIKNDYGYAVPMPVNYFFPNDWGVYDLFGNVAEMTSDQGVAMGGSCMHTADQCQPGVVNRYEAPAYWLGFRVVADVK